MTKSPFPLRLSTSPRLALTCLNLSAQIARTTTPPTSVSPLEARWLVELPRKQKPPIEPSSLALLAPPPLPYLWHTLPLTPPVMPQGLSYVPHVYLYLYSAIYTSRSLMCTTGLPCRSYWTFPLSQYLAALDLLMRHGLSAYLGHTSHAHAAPLTHTYLHCFWHA